MLKLRRKLGESVVVTTPSGDVIRFVLLMTQSGGASVGIEAPRAYVITRPECDPKPVKVTT